MRRRSRFQIPAASALITFESAARHGSFSRAAEELRTSQPAISRHIARLERELATPLFERSRTGVRLTNAGVRFRDAVVAGLGIIHWAATDVANQTNEQQVVIACSHCVSHFALMPRYSKLQEALGENVRVRVLTYHRDPKDLPPNPIADLILTWNKPRAAPGSLVPIYQEAVGPICSPSYIAKHGEVLNGPVTGWGELTMLGVSQPYEGSAVWDDWFQAVGYPISPPRTIVFDHYTYVLDAVAAGRGIALGWRGFFDQYVQSGTVTALTEKFVELDSYYYGVLTKKGRSTPLARRCLEFLKQSIERCV